ncbi:N-6 DNA methylase [Natronosalvus amylolyticus]|uniref:N-6 DNA methylase n=1 Tax=Natronosalvus amylolyticus TaxID=2961994 RepID=UPI0020C93A8A|nr:N-6 DNA methylase [Natronosalvus amylolyticus]
MSNDHVRSVLEPLERIEQRGFTRYEVFRDWVRLMLATLQRDDGQYLEVLDSYKRDGGVNGNSCNGGGHRERGDRNADLFAKAFGKLQQGMGETGRDVLGETYEAWGMQSDAFGQHFTPHPVARSMAAMQMGDSGGVEPPVTVCDPACGTGRLLVMGARECEQATFCWGQDKDLLCAQMTALNFCFFNLEGVVVYGDTLTLERKRAWRTHHSSVGGSVVELEEPEAVPVPQLLEERDSAERSKTDANRLAVVGQSEQVALTEWSA